MTPAADDLRRFTLQWAMPFWDHDVHMVWNPPGSLDEHLPERTVHLVPQTAWLAYGLLDSADAAERAEAVNAIDALLNLQYDAPGTAFHGTFALFRESRYPPADATIWVDYDPNWRQFVGTTFALMLRDFEHDLAPELVRRIESAIALACAGEPDGRIPVHYTNPALMRSWLDAWFGTRIGDRALTDRGETFARAIVAEHDRMGAFDEFNSPTYYGIDIYALRLWELEPPTSFFATEGHRIATQVWRHAAAFYNPNLRNFCGPFTRSYHPDATRSLALLAIWMWAWFGRSAAPLPDLAAASIDHGHDLMAGALFARLAGTAPGELIASDEPRDLTISLNNGREVTARIEHELMLGAESSGHDWGGWDQFMPITAHWAEDGDVATLWLVDPHVVRARVDGNTIRLDDGDASAHAFALIAPSCVATHHGFATPRMHVMVHGDSTEIAIELTGPGAFRLSVTNANALTFAPTARG